MITYKEADTVCEVLKSPRAQACAKVVDVARMARGMARRAGTHGAWHAELALNGAKDVRAARRPGPARRLPSPPSMHPHLPTLARAPPTRFTLTHPDCHNFTFVRSYRK